AGGFIWLQNATGGPARLGASGGGDAPSLAVGGGVALWVEATGRGNVVHGVDVATGRLFALQPKRDDVVFQEAATDGHSVVVQLERVNPPDHLYFQEPGSDLYAGLLPSLGAWSG
ncbi:MAG: hypothetical protein ACYDBQ_11915, partial [Thermoplasmatota archaeon]